MPGKQAGTGTEWVDPDDVDIEWTDEMFDMAAVHENGRLIRPATGKITLRGRPPSENPKQQITLRLDRDVVERFRQTGPGWQSRINEVLKKADI